MAEIGKGGIRNRHGNLKTENVKRPDHPDFMDSAELAKIQFSGVRHNLLAQDWEIWILGERKAFGPARDIEAFRAAYEEIFAIKNMEIVEFVNSPNQPKEKE